MRLSKRENCDSIEVIGNYSKSNFCQTPIVSKKGIAPCVTENHGQVTAIAIKNATKQGYLLAEHGDGIDISSRMETHRGTVQKGIIQTIKANLDVGVCVMSEENKENKNEDINDLRIRKLTPKECWRLMGWDDESFEKAEKVNSNSQLYKQAGNGIVVNVLEAIFKELV